MLDILDILLRQQCWCLVLLRSAEVVINFLSNLCDVAVLEVLLNLSTVGVNVGHAKAISLWRLQLHLLLLLLLLLLRVLLPVLRKQRTDMTHSHLLLALLLLLLLQLLLQLLLLLARQ